MGLKSGGLKAGGLRNLSATQLPEFSPSDIDTLSHWYDATEITGSDGDAIGTWADKEGTDDLTQATSSRKPTLKTGIINGKQILRFDGSDDQLIVDFADLSGYEVFTVAKLRSTGSTDFLWNSNGTNDSVRANGGNWEFAANAAIDGSAEDTNTHIFDAQENDPNSVFRLDGASDATGDINTGGLNGLYIGSQQGNNHGDYDVGEVLVYSSNLSAGDRGDVESYLADKWGVTLS